MRTGTTTVFRSTAPEVVAAWAADMVKAEAYRLRFKATMDDIRPFPEAKPLVRTYGGGFPVFTGFDVAEGVEVPHGWRETTRDGWVCLIPNKRVKAGKALQAKLDAAHEGVYRRAELPGMPPEVSVPGHWYTPGIVDIDGVVWASWSVPEGSTGYDGKPWDADVDLALWEPAKLSEFYAAKGQ